jgi:phosphoglycerol transferase MdoB-like AlkP superfamily enzyme
MKVLFSWFQSRRIHYLVLGTCGFFTLFAILRAVFYFGFSNLPQQGSASSTDLFNAVSLGLRFDLRVAILAMLPPALLLVLPWLNALKLRPLRWLLRLYLALITAGLLLVHAFDLGHYQYLGTRLNATVFRFLEDANISADMLWQSYPVIRISLGIVLVTAVFSWLMFKLERISLDRERREIAWTSRTIGSTVIIYLVFIGILGRTTNINVEGPVPIRWSDAYLTGSAELAALGLNPAVFLYETSRAREDTYDTEQVKKHYGLMAGYLGVSKDTQEAVLSASKTPNFSRKVPLQPHRVNSQPPPNIVFIMLESLGASRVGGYGNPLKPTPELDDIGRNGLKLNHFYVPVSGTAKTVWASITGIPDASYGKSATRNPAITHQNLALNALKSYTKIYAIGGNAGWANMKAFLNQSIEGVTLYEEGFWKSRNVDVWGISDLNLFKETDQILRSLPKDKPFFAYIQTAGNHEPFTIPSDSDDFVSIGKPEESLRLAGFRSERQFNAVRLLDYSVGRFMKLAKEGGYFENTIFVFFGDHNNRITTLPFLPPAFEQLNLESLHVPAYIYAPKLLKPKEFDEATSLVDLIPTALSLAGIEYTNTTLGRDIMLPAPEGERAVPTLMREGNFPLIGAVTKNFIVQMNADGTEATLHDIRSKIPLQNVADQYPQEFKRLSDLARGLHETSRFLMYANRVPTRPPSNTVQ